jgi:hypothetical protein
MFLLKTARCTEVMCNTGFEVRTGLRMPKKIGVHRKFKRSCKTIKRPLLKKQSKPQQEEMVEP